MKSQNRRLTFFCNLILMIGTACADEPPKTGNYALPVSQQPSPLISFGQLLIGGNQVQVIGSTYSPYHGIVGPFKNVNAEVVAGLTDNTTFYFVNPIDADASSKQVRFSTLRDLTFQLEQAYYSNNTSTYEEQGTIVGAYIVPTQEPHTDGKDRTFGSPAYFLGTTFNRMYNQWMAFVSPGALFTTKNRKKQVGRQYLYQAGLEYAIFSVPDESILYAMVEFDGQYSDKDKFFGKLYPNSGGNVVTVTPSLTLTTKKFMLTGGIGFPVVQHYFGNQGKTAYFLASMLTITIS